MRGFLDGRGALPFSYTLLSSREIIWGQLPSLACLENLLSLFIEKVSFFLSFFCFLFRSTPAAASVNEF